MKTSWLVSAVVAGHCVVIGAVMCVQGCGTTGPVSSSTTPPPEPTMPGEVAKPVPQIPSPVVQPKKMPVVAQPVKSWPADTTAYTVQKGDSVSLICARFHVSRAEVMGLNHIKDANKIVVGQELQLPGKVNLSAPVPAKKPKAAPVEKKAAATASKPTNASASDGGYVVKPGDVLSRIASRNKTTVAALKEANGLKSDKIVVGQKLKIPGVSSSESAVVAAPAPAAAPSSTVVQEGDADEVAPSTEVPLATPATGDAGAVAPTTTYDTYTAEANEDLYHVSLMWGVKIEELQRINGLGTNTALTAGQTLQIPRP